MHHLFMTLCTFEAKLCRELFRYFQRIIIFFKIRFGISIKSNSLYINQRLKSKLSSQNHPFGEDLGQPFRLVELIPLRSA